MDTIKKQTTAPEWGTLAGELPKEFTDKIGEDLKDALHVRGCGTGIDIDAIQWAYGMLWSNRQFLFGYEIKPEIVQMMDRLKSMLKEYKK
uniref:Uncharacterized protein n=1 Tax=Candidatus Nitrotoga fabula TaxID=2182327 RepID=A0A2X0QVB0_9PROT|nr:protein of unknown function [Candidatus Nitrotoga fabula]